MANDDNDGWSTVGTTKKKPVPKTEDKAADVKAHWDMGVSNIPHIEKVAKLYLKVKEWETRPQTPVVGDKTPTVCYFLEPAEENKDLFKWHVDCSGRSMDKTALKDLRVKAGISADKDTICAEENFATSHAQLIKRVFYSIAFDKYGAKASCTGCFKLLQLHGVVDLARKCPY